MEGDCTNNCALVEVSYNRFLGPGMPVECFRNQCQKASSYI